MFAQSSHTDWQPRGNVQQGGWKRGGKNQQQGRGAGRRWSDVWGNHRKTFAFPVTSCDEPQIRFNHRFVLIPHSLWTYWEELLLKLGCSSTLTKMGFSTDVPTANSVFFLTVNWFRHWSRHNISFKLNSVRTNPGFNSKSRQILASWQTTLSDIRHRHKTHRRPTLTNEFSIQIWR